MDICFITLEISSSEEDYSITKSKLNKVLSFIFYSFCNSIKFFKIGNFYKERRDTYSVEISFNEEQIKDFITLLKNTYKEKKFNFFQVYNNSIQFSIKKIIYQKDTVDFQTFLNRNY